MMDGYMKVATKARWLRMVVQRRQPPPMHAHAAAAWMPYQDHFPSYVEGSEGNARLLNGEYYVATLLEADGKMDVVQGQCLTWLQAVDRTQAIQNSGSLKTTILQPGSDI